jgi:hypothetical protein
MDLFESILHACSVVGITALCVDRTGPMGFALLTDGDITKRNSLAALIREMPLGPIGMVIVVGPRE